MLQRNGAAAAEVVRGLSDEQLERTTRLPFMGHRPVTTAQVIEGALIAHMEMHRETLQPESLSTPVTS